MDTVNVDRIVAADPVTDPLWRTLATSPGVGLFTSPPWLAAVCGTYGFAAEARIALDPAGAPTGGFSITAGRVTDVGTIALQVHG